MNLAGLEAGSAMRIARKAIADGFAVYAAFGRDRAGQSMVESLTGALPGVRPDASALATWNECLLARDSVQGGQAWESGNAGDEGPGMGPGKDADSLRNAGHLRNPLYVKNARENRSAWPR